MGITKHHGHKDFPKNSATALTKTLLQLVTDHAMLILIIYSLSKHYSNYSTFPHMKNLDGEKIITIFQTQVGTLTEGTFKI